LVLEFSVLFTVHRATVSNPSFFKFVTSVYTWTDEGRSDGGWRKLHNLFSSPSTIRMIKSRRMRWAGSVTRMGAKMNAYRILVGKPEETVRKTKT
jgi:hypothetical protein